MPRQFGGRLLALLTLVVLSLPYSKGLACDAGEHVGMDTSTMVMPDETPPQDHSDVGDCHDVMVCGGCGGMTAPGVVRVPISAVHGESISELTELERDDTLTPLTPPPKL